MRIHLNAAWVELQGGGGLGECPAHGHSVLSPSAAVGQSGTRTPRGDAGCWPSTVTRRITSPRAHSRDGQLLRMPPQHVEGVATPTLTVFAAHVGPDGCLRARCR